MSNPGAFSGTYADWKLIKTRGVVQIVIEVPLAASGAAYEVLGGMPNAANEIWCAVALLKQKGGDAAANNEPRQVDTSPRQETKTGGARSWGDLPYSQQAALACNDPVFRAFLREWHKLPADTEEQAADSVRAWCGVDSRAGLNTRPDAAAAWLRMHDRFKEWKLYDQVAS